MLTLRPIIDTGDFAKLNFTGTAIEVFGLKDPLGGRYNITLDGVTVSDSLDELQAFRNIVGIAALTYSHS